MRRYVWHRHLRQCSPTRLLVRDCATLVRVCIFLWLLASPLAD